MLKTTRSRTAQVILGAVAVMGLPVATHAATISIILSNMDVTYSGATSGGSLYDMMGGFGGGSLAEATADDISTAVYEVDGNPVGSALVNTAADGDDIHVDFRVRNIGATVTKGTFYPTLGNNSNDFGLDYFTDIGHRLRLNVNSVGPFYIDNNVMFFSGEGTIYDQNLPSGLVFDASKPVVFSFTASLPAVPNTANIGMALGSGALTISGTAIPEPTAAVVIVGMALAVSSIGLFRRPRRR